MHGHMENGRTATEKTVAELDKMIRSRAGVIYIVGEERRVLESLVKYAAEPVNSLSGQQLLPSRQVWTWRMTRGIEPLELSGTGDVVVSKDASRNAKFDSDATKHPAQALDHIGAFISGDGATTSADRAAAKTRNASLFVLLDFHRHVASASENGTAQPLFERALRDLYSVASTSRSVIILLSPRPMTWIDAEQEVRLIEWPNPDRLELFTLIEEVANDMPDHIDTAMDDDGKAGGTRPLIRQNVGDQFNSALGGTEANIRSTFRLLESVGPAIWQIDEIEKMFPKGQGEQDGGTGRRVLGMMLTFMEERKERAPLVLPVVTANDVSSIPPELLSRFEWIFGVDLPTEPECEQILRIHAAKREIEFSNEEFAGLAAVANERSLTGREIERCVKASKRRCYKTDFDLFDALINALKQIKGLAASRPKDVAAIRAWIAEHAMAASSAAHLGDDDAPTVEEDGDPVEYLM